MRKILALIAALLWALPASAQIVGTLPFTLQNGTIADANQVMSDLNTIVAAVNANAANAGANTNINALNNLTTPLVYTSGGTSNYIGGTSSGAANAQVIASPIPSGFTLVTGKSVTFSAGFTNTNAMTLNVASTGATNVFKQTSSGIVALSGGELVVGQIYTAVFDGTEYQIQGPSPQGSVLPCTTIDWVGASPPAGYIIEGGQALSRTTFSALFTCIAVQGVAATTTISNASVVVPNSALFQIGWSVGGNNVTCNATVATIPDGTHITLSSNAGASGATTLTIGPYPQGDCSTTFNLPNLSGRATVMRDVSGTILTSTTCGNPASIGSNCATQTQTLVTGNLPAYTPAGAITNGAITFPNSVITSTATGANAGMTTGPSTANANLTAVLVPIQASTTFAGTAQGGTSTPFSNLQPSALVDKYIKF
jgi:hypothetical protein